MGDTQPVIQNFDEEGGAPPEAEQEPQSRLRIRVGPSVVHANVGPSVLASPPAPTVLVPVPDPVVPPVNALIMIGASGSSAHVDVSQPLQVQLQLNPNQVSVCAAHESHINFRVSQVFHEADWQWDLLAAYVCLVLSVLLGMKLTEINHKLKQSITSTRIDLAWNAKEVIQSKSQTSNELTHLHHIVSANHTFIVDDINWLAGDIITLKSHTALIDTTIEHRVKSVELHNSAIQAITAHFDSQQSKMTKLEQKNEQLEAELQRLKSIKPRQSLITDAGHLDKLRGWFDVQGQGVKNDYCRIIGEGEGWFSCALAGSDNERTAPGVFEWKGGKVVDGPDWSKELASPEQRWKFQLAA